MKKLVISIATISGIFFSSAIFAQEKIVQPVTGTENIQPKTITPPVQPTATPTAQPKSQAPVAVKTEAEDSPNPVYCLGRGIANISTCWLEIPRCTVYDNKEIPFFGLIVGIPEGAIFTVVRAFTGVYDILSFGFSGNALHGKSFPDFIWQSNWLPPEKNK
ncbi:MAG: hypothetical protein WC071_08920 [Victivallaceae bacterium]